MKIEIGKFQKQPQGFEAFIPQDFPPEGIMNLSTKILIKTDEASRLIGKLDGITHKLPEVDYFLYMFVAKDATSSAQIEGTKATIVDAVEKDAGVASKETDADDILYYTKALHYGLERMKEFPFSLRFIKELHLQLMTGARATHFADPGEFRQSQNWIGATNPSEASYVPPPVHEMQRSLNDLEFFLRDKETLPLIQAALAHAQFETIHPFLDGNGRTGRLLVTMLFCYRNILELPVLFLSSYFKKYQKVYYSKLNGYHDGQVEEWISFFLDGIIETANHAIDICKQITDLRDRDMEKIQALARRESESGVRVLRQLYARPIINSRTVMEWTKFTRAGAQKLIDRFVSMGILELKDDQETYDRTYIYKDYMDIFTNSQ